MKRYYDKTTHSMVFEPSDTTIEWESLPQDFLDYANNLSDVSYEVNYDEDGMPVVKRLQLKEDGTRYSHYLEDGKPDFVAIELAKAKEEADRLAKEAQEAKQLALDTITVEVNSKVFDGRDKDQTRMMAAIQASELLGITTAEWKLHNDEVVEVTVDELKQALALSIQEVGRIIKEL